MNYVVATFLFSLRRRLLPPAEPMASGSPASGHPPHHHEDGHHHGGDHDGGYSSDHSVGSHNSVGTSSKSTFPNLSLWPCSTV